MDASIAFAENAVRTRYEDLPQRALQATKADILDTIGTALAGSTAPGGREIVALVEEWGEKKEATLIGKGDKVLAIGAALANGAMAHALDYDDAHEIAHLHAGVTTIPAAMAIAEHIGGVSGKEVLTAVTLGIDVVCRMGLANPEGPAGFILTAVYGFFGAAVTAGKLLGLNREQMVSALGIAYAQAAGNNQCVEDAVLTKRMQAGFAAKGGVVAALMAQKGITGARESLEGTRGLYNVYHGGRYNPAALTDELGKRFEGANLSFKPYPCGRVAHAHIDAALALGEEHDVNPSEVKDVLAYVGKQPHVMFDPLEIKRNPRTAVDAQFSIPYLVATALVKRRVTISDFAPDALKDPVVLGLASKVRPVVDSSLGGGYAGTPGPLEIRTGRGTYSRRIDYPRGHPENPMSHEALVAKFRDCASYSVRPIAEAEISGLIDIIDRLEDVEDMDQVFRLLR